MFLCTLVSKNTLTHVRVDDRDVSDLFSDPIQLLDESFIKL